MSSEKDPKIAEMGKEVFLAMASPRVFSISAYKIAFRDAAHKRGIWHHLDREGYNCYFRTTMGEVKKHITAAKKAEQKKLAVAAPKIIRQQLRLF
jgi:hypothetical protein